jgi:hypothetical protein
MVARKATLHHVLITHTQQPAVEENRSYTGIGIGMYNVYIHNDTLYKQTNSNIEH